MQPTTPADQTGRAPIAILGVPFDGVSLAEVLALAATTSASAFGIPLVVNSPAGIAGTYADTATLTFARRPRLPWWRAR